MFLLRVTLFIFLLLPAGSLTVGAQGSGARLTAIGFYNVENLFHPDDDPEKDDDDFTPSGAYRYSEEIYRQKLHNIAFAISKLGIEETGRGADIVGLAEVENGKAVADLVAQPELKESGYQYIIYNSPDVRGIDVALLYRTSAFEPLHTRPVRLSMPHKHTRDILYVAGVLHGDTIHLLVNHWPSRRKGKEATAWARKLAAGAARRLTDSILESVPSAKIILMGDLNDGPKDASVANVLNAKYVRASLEVDDLYNPWLALKNAGAGSLLYRRKWYLYDQILVSRSLVSGGGNLKYHSANVFNADFLIHRYGRYKGAPYRAFRGTYWMNGYSDHFPVLIFLEQGTARK